MFADAVESSVGGSGARKVKNGEGGARASSVSNILGSTSNGLTAVLLVANISNGITRDAHVWSVCGMELMDSSRKNSISPEKKGEPGGMGWRSALM